MVSHTQTVSLGKKPGWGSATPNQRCHSPVMGTSGRGCSFLQDGTNTVMSVWPRSRNQFTARRMPRQENTSLFPWLGRRRGTGSALEGGWPAIPSHRQEGVALQASALGSAHCPLAQGLHSLLVPTASGMARPGTFPEVPSPDSEETPRNLAAPASHVGEGQAACNTPGGGGKALAAFWFPPHPGVLGPRGRRCTQAH